MFGEGPCRKDLLRQTHSLDLEEQVRFRGFRPDVRDFLPGYRAYVHASYSESLPLAIIEAMAAGLPIVAGDTGGISELCDDGVEARFWPLDDPAHAAATLDRLARLRADASNGGERREQSDSTVTSTQTSLRPRLLSFLQGRTTPRPQGCPNGVSTSE